MQQAPTVGLAPRAKKHGACQPVRAGFTSPRRPIGTFTHCLGAFQVPTGRREVPGPPTSSHPSEHRRRGLWFDEPIEAWSRLKHTPRTRLSSPLCTCTTAHSELVTSRHARVTLLQCSCRYMLPMNLFILFLQGTGTGFAPCSAAGMTGDGLIHKVIHTSAP